MSISQIRKAFPLAIGLAVASIPTFVVAQTAPTQEKPVQQQEQESATDKAEEKAEIPEPIQLNLAGGKVKLTASGDWKKIQPKSNMAEAEIQIPKLNEDDANTGRLTFMMAGGSLDANIARWKASLRNHLKR